MISSSVRSCPLNATVLVKMYKETSKQVPSICRTGINDLKLRVPAQIYVDRTAVALSEVNDQYVKQAAGTMKPQGP